MNKIKLVLLCCLLTIFVLTGCDSKDATIAKQEATISASEKEIATLEERIDTLSTKIASLEKKIDFPTFLKIYHTSNLQIFNGYYKYIGKEPARIYPHNDAPYLNAEKNYNVEFINRVSCDGEDWSLVRILSSNRHVNMYGFVKEESLIEIPNNEIPTYPTLQESLGEFAIGDKIEKLIGNLNLACNITYENTKIYNFSEGNINDFTGYKLQAFVDEYEKVTFLSSSTPKFALKDGFKVGDSAYDAIEFYKSKYDVTMTYDSSDPNIIYNSYYFNIEDNYHLIIVYEDGELTLSSKIIRIEIGNLIE